MTGLQIFAMVLAVLLGFLAWQRDSVWYWLGIVGSVDLVFILSAIGDGRSINTTLLQVDMVVFLGLLAYWVYTLPPTNPEHIRYRVRH